MRGHDDITASPVIIRLTRDFFPSESHARPTEMRDEPRERRLSKSLKTASSLEFSLSAACVC